MTFFILHSVPLFGDTSDNDILERNDVQKTLFGHGSFFSLFNSEYSSFRGELVGSVKSFKVAAQIVRKYENYLKTSWGIEFGDRIQNDRLLNLKGGLFLGWDEYLIQPFAGVDIGLTIFPEKARDLNSYVLLGSDFKISDKVGLSTRERWSFPKNSFPAHQPFRFKMENALFELVLFWQI